MEHNPLPTGEERQVQTLGGAAIDGTPIAYIIVLAAVVTALSFIPFSIVLSSGGGSMPLSQSVFPLLGWLLGPIAGAVASGIGGLIGVFFAPYTAGIPVLSIWGAMLTSFTAGTMAIGQERKSWYLGLSAVFALQFCFYGFHAIAQNGISLPIFIAGTLIDWLGLLLFVLPTRRWFAQWIHSQQVGLMAMGVFCGTWMISGVVHLSIASITYYMFNWPEEVWITLIPVIPVENLVRCVTATVIGTGVISGLRAMNLVKPKQAIY